MTSNRLIVQRDDLVKVKPKANAIDSDGMTREQVEANKLKVDANGNLITSIPTDLTMASKGYHLPILDLDFRHTWAPSQTPGHAHLYIHQYMHKEKLSELLVVLHRAGLMGQGNLNQFDVHGMLLARRPLVVGDEVDALGANPEPPAF